MSYAIIRNENYKMGQLSYIYRHNERKNTNYSNKDISRQNSTKNYSLKSTRPINHEEINAKINMIAQNKTTTFHCPPFPSMAYPGIAFAMRDKYAAPSCCNKYPAICIPNTINIP